MGRARDINDRQRKAEAKRLRMLREGFKWSQTKLAEEWYTNHSSISQWESGNTTMPGLALKLLEIYEGKLERFRGE